MIRNSLEKYGWPAKLFHWLIAIAIIGLIAVGLIMEGMDMSPNKIELYGLHKSTGVLVLFAVVARYLWRITNPVPLLPSNLRKIEKFMAHAAHYALYGFMLLMPISGWLMSSAAGFPVSVYGWFTMPDLVQPDQDLRHLFHEVHEISGIALIALISLHALAALLHHFYHKDNVLRRMLPFGKLKV